MKYGVKSGQDSFFYPKDCSRDALAKYPDAKVFVATYNVPRQDVESGDVSLILCGEGLSEVHPIESKYLEPEIHSLMEINNFTVTPDDCNRKIILIDKKKKNIKGTYASEYIEWGESQGFHKNETCSARVTDDREWYDLTDHKRALALWPKEKQYRHIAPANEHRLIANCRLYEIYPKNDLDDPNIWAAALNSIVVILSSFQYGRPMGTEGNWSTMVSDVNMMLVPDLRKASQKQIKRVVTAFEKIKKRSALAFLSERRLREMNYRHKGKEHELELLSNECELDMDDRHELDDAILELIGIKNSKERKEYLNKLYNYLAEFFEWTRQKEEKAILNKGANSRRGKTQPVDIARQIMSEIEEKEQKWLKTYESNFLDSSKPFDTYDVPLAGIPEVFSDLFTSTGVKFNLGRKKRLEISTRTEIQAKLLCEVSKWGIRGLVRIPYQEDECENVLNSYSRFMRQREDRIWQLIEERTKDEDIQQKIYESLIAMLTRRV